MVATFDDCVALRDDDFRLAGRDGHALARIGRGVLAKAAHDEPHVHIMWQVDFADAAADHARTFAVAAGDDLQRFGHAAAQAVDRLDIAAAHIGEQFAQHGLCRRERDVDLRAVHQVGVGAAVDERQYPTRAHALGEQAGHDVVLVVVGEGEEQVHLFDAFVAEQVFVGGIPVQHEHLRGQHRSQFRAAIGIRLQDLDVEAALLRQLAREPQPHPAAARNHDAAHRPRRHTAALVQRREHPRDLLTGGEYEDFITGLDASGAVAGHETVGLFRKAAVDRDHAHGDIGSTGAHVGDAHAHDRCAGPGPDRGQAGTAARELPHLQGLGILDELADVTREGLFRADDAVHRQALLAEQRATPLVAGAEARGAHARDARGHVEEQLGDLAADQVGFIERGAGDEQVGIRGSGLGQHFRIDAAADDTAQVETRLQVAQAPGVGVDDGDVVLLGHQAVGHALAHAARAQDDDLHLARTEEGGSAPAAVRSCADVALAEHHPLERGESLDAHRAARMEFVGADADLGAQAVLEAVGETGAGIHHHAGRVHFAQEALGMHVVPRKDGVGVVAAVAVDVADRLVQAVHHLDADDGCEVLLGPVLLGGRHERGARHGGQQGQGIRAAAHFHALGRIDGADPREEFRRHATRDEQPFAGIAGTVLLRLGVVGHLHGHGDIAGVVHVGVAVAVQVLDDGHLGIAADALDQALAAAGDDDVHVLRHGDEVPHGFAVGGLHELHGIAGQAGLLERLLHKAREGPIGIDGLGTAPQNAGVAALDAQRGGLDGHVGAAFVDHAEDADRHAHLAHADAAGLLAHAGYLADHVAHGCELFAAQGAGLQDLGSELEPVHHGLGEAGSPGAFEIAGVVRLQGDGVVAQAAGQRQQCPVLDGRWRPGHQRGGGLGLGSEGVESFGDVLRVHGRDFDASLRSLPGAGFPAGQHVPVLLPSPAMTTTPTTPLPAAQLTALATAVEDLRAARMAPHAFSEVARAQTVLLEALPPRYAQVLADLLDRLESSALFSEESCSFSQGGLIDSLETWVDKARGQVNAQ